MREGYYIKNNDCVNKNIAGRTIKEWYEDNKEKLLKQQKQYYVDNKEKIQQNSIRYYNDNKEKINKQHRQYSKQYLY